ncbi:hypothetical protein B0H66DRAFT_587804 [Apodospora peruviana]|uniref:Uncharacterized protein n=1 Tax=Apodospora peruviana TaxID=516989 RepID=A0AAE0MAG1_9PEZI|nr:hypothetical protein B0H66DRAFT_587804 [Apodospora peruviana]
MAPSVSCCSLQEMVWGVNKSYVVMSYGGRTEPKREIEDVAGGKTSGPLSSLERTGYSRLWSLPVVGLSRVAGQANKDMHGTQASSSILTRKALTARQQLMGRTASLEPSTDLMGRTTNMWPNAGSPLTIVHTHSFDPKLTPEPIFRQLVQLSLQQTQHNRQHSRDSVSTPLLSTSSSSLTKFLKLPCSLLHYLPTYTHAID